MTVPACCPLDDQDPIILDLLRLAAEVILAHPEAVPAGLYEQCDGWAGDLAAAVNTPAGTKRADPGRTRAATGEPEPAAIMPGPAGPAPTAACRDLVAAGEQEQRI